MVTAIAPGPFKSDMNKAARDHADEVATRVPSRRIGTDEDMAGAAIYLASRAGDYVVGNTIAVDGGIVYANAGHQGRRVGLAAGLDWLNARHSGERAT